MVKPFTLGLCGFAGAGKHTVADLLVAHAGFRKLAFADALRGEVAQAFGIDIGLLADPVAKSRPMAALAMRRAPRDFLAAVVLAMSQAAPDHMFPLTDEWLDAPRTPRQILQWWGTEYRRAQHPRYWTRILVERVSAYRQAGELRIVVTDVRFDEEAEALRAMGARLWQVRRPGLAASTTTEGRHASVTDGTGRWPIAAIIANTFDVRHLQQVVLGEWLTAEAGLEAGRVSVKVTTP